MGQFMQQMTRLGFRQSGVVAGVEASVNTGVVAFANEPVAAIPASRTPLAQWCTVSTVAASATAGTSYKFLRKGIFTAHLIVPLSAGLTTGAFVGISLDCPAAQLLIAGITPATALTTMEDFDFQDGVAAATMALHARAPIMITNPLRGSLPLAANGTAPGTMRIHTSDGAGATIGSAATVDANVTLWVNGIAELFG